MSEIDAEDFEAYEAALQFSSRGCVCCLRCRRMSTVTSLGDHFERAHRRHVVTMEPGELEAVIELIRARLVTDRMASGGSVFAGPRTERERLLWNFFVRHDKRLRKLWTFLNSPEEELETEG